MMLELAFDALLATLVLGLAWAALFARDTYQAVVLFVAFGVVVALVWARLDAVDVAIAEAAIGAGLTGAILLAFVADSGRAVETVAPARPSRRVRAVAAALVGLSAAGLLVAVLDLPRQGNGLSRAVAAAMPRSGVEHEVTAVLLDFRSWDTLLEVAVLATAGLAAAAVWGRADLSVPRVSEPPSPLLAHFASVSVPFLVLLAGYLVWLGTSAPGGAFQAGAVLAAAAVLLTLIGRGSFVALNHAWQRALLALGLAAFCLAGAEGLLGRDVLLRYQPDRAGLAIVLVEQAVTVSVAVTLAVLYVAASPRADGEAAAP
jgi:multisubunit Na+/H+ antiporter MnhB subunit